MKISACVLLLTSFAAGATTAPKKPITPIQSRIVAPASSLIAPEHTGAAPAPQGARAAPIHP